MIKLGEAPVIQVPTMDYRFLTMSDEKQKAYKESISQLNQKARKSLSDGFSFNSNGTLQGSNPFLQI